MFLEKEGKHVHLQGLSRIGRVWSWIRGRDSGVPTEAELPKDTVTIRPTENASLVLTQKPPQLQRPVILVNGLARDAHEWNKLVPWLTSHPKNVFGGVYQCGKESAFQEAIKTSPKAKIFVIDPIDNLSSPRVIGSEIRRMIDHIVKETGSPKVDIVAHSQGGLNTLAALDQGEDQIGKVVSLATPWKGASIASLARTFDGMAGRKFENLLAPLGQDRGALLDLRPLENNDWLQGARDRLRVHETPPQFFSLIGSGTPTPGDLQDRVVPGDGFVSVESGLGMEGAQNYHLPPGDWKPGDDAFRGFHLLDVNHSGIVGNSEAFQKVGQILAGSEPRDALLSTSPAIPKRLSEKWLDAGEDLIHDHLRGEPNSQVCEWSPELDEIRGLRQKLVETDIDFRTAESRQTRGKWLSRVGAAGVLVGLAATGPIGILPGLALAGFGMKAWLGGEIQENQIVETQQNLESKTLELRKEIERDLKSKEEPRRTPLDELSLTRP